MTNSDKLITDPSILIKINTLNPIALPKKFMKLETSDKDMKQEDLAAIFYCDNNYYDFKTVKNDQWIHLALKKSVVANGLEIKLKD